jgi:Fungal Zn(2)-Cys(6) binuclear cluster domain
MATSGTPRAEKVASSGEQIGDDSTTRCNRCILSRRKCDGVKPVCGLCSERGIECIYGKMGVTRAYLEGTRKGAEGFRHRAANERLQTRRESGSATISERRGFSSSLLAMTQGEPGWEDLKALYRGHAVPDDELFDDTTRMYTAFRRSEGSIADEWASEQHVGLELKWAEHEYWGEDAGEALLSNLRHRLGLTGV